MRNSLIAIFFCCPLLVAAQTKKIAFKSHNGDMNQFRAALVFDSELDNSNFGMVIQRDVVNAVLDSVYVFCDETAIMVTSEWCSRRGRPDSKLLWKAGRDTVFNHPVFNKRLSLDSMRKRLRSYYFKNKPEDVIFILEAEPVTRLVPATEDNKRRHSGNDWMLSLVLLGLPLLSVWMNSGRQA